MKKTDMDQFKTCAMTVLLRSNDTSSPRAGMENSANFAYEYCIIKFTEYEIFKRNKSDHFHAFFGDGYNYRMYEKGY